MPGSRTGPVARRTVRRNCSTCRTSTSCSPCRTVIEVIAFQNQTVVYDILFRAASETLRTIAADPEHLGAEIGFLGVLHTWGQNLLHHPHIHFLVPGGGIAPDGKAGSPAGRGSSCRSGCCRGCSEACSCTTWRRRSPPAS